MMPGRPGDPAYLAVTDVGGGREPGAAGYPLGGQVAWMDMGYDGPSSLLQQGHEAARGFRRVAAALRGPDHHPGDRLAAEGCACERVAVDAHRPARRKLVSSRQGCSLTRINS